MHAQTADTATDSASRRTMLESVHDAGHVRYAVSEAAAAGDKDFLQSVDNSVRVYSQPNSLSESARTDSAEHENDHGDGRPQAGLSHSLEDGQRPPKGESPTAQDMAALRAENAELRQYLQRCTKECQRQSDHNRLLLQRLDEKEELCNHLGEACLSLKHIAESLPERQGEEWEETNLSASPPAHHGSGPEHSEALLVPLCERAVAQVTQCCLHVNSLAEAVRDGTLHERERPPLLGGGGNWATGQSGGAAPRARPSLLFLRLEQALVRLDESVAQLEAEVSVCAHRTRLAEGHSPSQATDTTTDAHLMRPSQCPAVAASPPQRHRGPRTG